MVGTGADLLFWLSTFIYLQEYIMGMSMRGTSNTSGSQATSSTSAWQTKKQDFLSLSKAQQSGNLDQAKAAYAQLQKDAPAGATQDPNSPMAQIGTALQNGDVAGAQKAMASMKTHHGRGSAGASTSTTATSAVAPLLSNPTSTLGNNVNTLA